MTAMFNSWHAIRILGAYKNEPSLVLHKANGDLLFVDLSDDLYGIQRTMTNGSLAKCIVRYNTK